MHEKKESMDAERTISLEGILELCGRNLRLVTVVTLACLVASLSWLATKDPVFRAKATLILDEDGAASGILGDLASLTKAPKAAAEMELLRARTTAERTVAAAAADADEARYAGELERRQGLRTRVEDPTLRPLDRLLSGGRPDDLPGLRAHVETLSGETLDEDLWIEFVDASTVRVGTSRWLGLGTGDVRELAFVPGRPVEYGDALLTLRPQGDLTGRSFRIVHSTHSEAVERLMESLRVRETQRNSGVMELTFDDSDPVRAAATANAVCRNYLDRNKLRGEKRASQTVDFIQDQLASQIDALHAAEDEVVELQKVNPRAIDVSKSAEALIERLAELEVQRVQDQLMQVSLGQALDKLRSGDVDALSRLTIELADPITTTYVEGIARLAAEYELQDRSDVGAFKTMLQQKALELEVQRDAVALEIEALRQAVAAVDAGDVQAVGRIASGEGSAADPLLSGYLEDLATLQGEHDALARQFKAAHPDLAQLVHRIEAARARINALLSNRLAGLETRRDEHGRAARLLPRAGAGLPGGRARAHRRRAREAARAHGHAPRQPPARPGGPRGVAGDPDRVGRGGPGRAPRGGARARRSRAPAHGPDGDREVPAGEPAGSPDHARGHGRQRRVHRPGHTAPRPPRPVRPAAHAARAPGRRVPVDGSRLREGVPQPRGVHLGRAGDRHRAAGPRHHPRLPPRPLPRQGRGRQLRPAARRPRGRDRGGLPLDAGQPEVRHERRRIPHAHLHLVHGQRGQVPDQPSAWRCPSRATTSACS